MYTVKETSDFAGISIRALHHYDNFGLLKPTAVSLSGYRLYSDTDLERLQEILFFKELGFALKEIKNILCSPDYDRKHALRSHKKMLLEKKKRLDGLINVIDKTLTSTKGDKDMKNEEMFEGFDDSSIEEFKKEARERWGHTDAYKESDRRNSKYSKAVWDEIKAESSDIFNSLALLMGEGKEPSDSEVQKQINRWFVHINKRHYTCTPDIFRSMADMYVADNRFSKTYDGFRPGLAEFKRDAMHIYCDKMTD